MTSRSKSVMGGHKSGSKKSGGKVHHVSVHHAANGGYIVKHHKDSAESPEDEQHIAQDLPAMQQNVADAMPPQGAPAPAPAPAPAAPPAAPPAGM